MNSKIHLGDKLGERKVVFIHNYPIHRDKKNGSSYIENRDLFWLLCKCGDLKPLKKGNALKSKLCKNCANKQSYAIQIAVERKRAKLAASITKKKKKPKCMICKKPSAKMTCSDCLSTIIHNRK